MKKHKFYILSVLFVVLSAAGILAYQRYSFNQKVSHQKKELVISEGAMKKFADNYFKCDKKAALIRTIDNHELRVRNLIALVPEQYVEIENKWEIIKAELTAKISQCP